MRITKKNGQPQSGINGCSHKTHGKKNHGQEVRSGHKRHQKKHKRTIQKTHKRHLQKERHGRTMPSQSVNRSQLYHGEQCVMRKKTQKKNQYKRQDQIQRRQSGYHQLDSQQEQHRSNHQQDYQPSGNLGCHHSWLKRI